MHSPMSERTNKIGQLQALVPKECLAGFRKLQALVPKECLAGFIQPMGAQKAYVLRQSQLSTLSNLHPSYSFNEVLVFLAKRAHRVGVTGLLQNERKQLHVQKQAQSHPCSHTFTH